VVALPFVQGNYKILCKIGSNIGQQMSKTVQLGFPPDSQSTLVPVTDKCVSLDMSSVLGIVYLFMITAALCNRAGHYIFALWILLLSIFLSFSSPNLSRRRLDVRHTSTHGVGLVRI